MNIIEAQNISKIITENDFSHKILNNISLSIKQGEFVGITGKSGAGKSTLLYHLSALDNPTSGSVIVDGLNLQTANEDELDDFRLNTLGYVFQDYAIVPDLSVEENVFLPLMMRGVDYDDGIDLVLQTLSLVGMLEKVKSMPSQLSGGEQQRVSIARAIINKPKILFADEPTANLDSTSGRAVINLFTKLHESGQTIVMITHEDEYTVNCSRLITLEDGAVINDITKENFRRIIL